MSQNQAFLKTHPTAIEERALKESFLPIIYLLRVRIGERWVELGEGSERWTDNSSKYLQTKLRKFGNYFRQKMCAISLP